MVVAARLSLSFPVLLSAVPLYRFDFSDHRVRAGLQAWRGWLREHPDDDLTALDPGRVDLPVPVLRRCWISDGGMTANLPLHFFDTPLPERPSFVINLRPRSGAPDEPDVQLAENNNQGRHGVWNDLGVGEPSLPRFVGAILATMQNWVDNAQMVMPGYRDRIVTVRLAPEEGGTNLDMDQQRITGLGERGQRAADVLVERFTGAGWANHRWVRFRSVLGMLERLLQHTGEVWDADPGPAAATYRDLAAGVGRPGSYPLTAGAAQRIDQLQGIATSWREPEPGHRRGDGRVLVDGEPRPRPRWRAQPEL